MATSNFLTESVPKIREATMENSRDLNKLMVSVDIEKKELEFLIDQRNELLFLSHDSIREKMLQENRFSSLQIDLSKEENIEKHKQLVLKMIDENRYLIDIRQQVVDANTKIYIAGSQISKKQCKLNNSTKSLLELLTKQSIKNSEKLDQHQQHMQTMHGQYIPEFKRIERKNRSFFFSRDCLQRENDFEI